MKAHVANICFKYFRRFRGMLQLFLRVYCKSRLRCCIFSLS
jgi:hypothetical protein